MRVKTLNFNRLFLIILTLSLILSISSVSSVDLNDTDVNSLNEDYSYSQSDIENNNISSTSVDLYVDNDLGNNNNDGRSWQYSVKTFDNALDLSSDGDSIYLANGTYSGEGNTKITIDKSVNVIGSGNTIFDGQISNFIFNIPDNVKITFKNIKFVNAYKKPSYWDNNIVYGGALEIGNATVTIDNCIFADNVVDYEATMGRPTFGGAISNFGDLTISNSYFDNNLATSTSGIFAHGGSIYNKGKLVINSAIFNNSFSQDFGYGGAIYNDGDMIMNNSMITNSRASQECKGSAIYNAGNCTLLNSIIQNNNISRANFYYIFGAIYNLGNLNGIGNIFRNNTGIYQSPNPEYKGSPNIYNDGYLNLTYNIFMDNAPFNGIASDVYIAGGKIVSLDENWWDTNGHPYNENKINVNQDINSWFVFNLNPDYSALAIGDDVKITASLTSTNPVPVNINSLPVLNVTFNANVNGQLINFVFPLNNGVSTFDFNYTRDKGLYEVVATVGHVNQTVLVDVGKLNSNVKYNITEEIFYTQDVIIDVEVVSDDLNSLNGNVSPIVGDSSYSINLTNGKGKITIPNLLPDTYDVKIVYEGNENYFKSFKYANVTVKKAPTSLNISVSDIKIDQKGSIRVILGPSGVQGQAYVYIDGVRKKVAYLYNGQNDIYLSNFAEGEYNVTVEFLGNSYYNSSSASAKFKVSKYETILNISVSDIKVGENQSILILSSPDDLTGEAILSINGVNNTIFLKQGKTSISISDLGPGTYDIVVTFPENQKYSTSTASASFKVMKTLTNLSVDITQKDLNAKIVVKTNYTECSGTVGMYVNFKRYNMNLKNGVATFDVTLDKGTNYIYVFYNGDSVYEGSDWNTTLGVDDEFIFIGSNVTGFEHNDFNYTIRLIEYNGIPMPARTVSILFNEKNYTVTTNDDGFAYLLLNLVKGDYKISATYKNQTISNDIIINEIKFNVVTNEIRYGENETIEVIFDENLTGKANLFIENILNVTSDIVNGKVAYNVSGLNVGKYEVIVKYVNNYFESDENSSNFEVIKANPVINAEINDVVYGQDGVITIMPPVNATGTLLVVIDGNESLIEINSSKLTITLTDLYKGSHTVEINYSGDLNYNNATLKDVFYVKDAVSPLNLTINDSKYGENITVVAILNDNVTGNVTFNVSGISKIVEIKNGVANWTFSGIGAGTYTIYAVYGGDRTYISSKNSTAFNVFKNNSTLKLYVREVYLNENIRIYASLSPNATGSVSFSIIDYYSPRNRAISNSMASWYISPLGTGKYTVIATYAGDNNYYESNDTFVLEVNQRKSILDVSIANVGINDRITVNVKLTSSDGQPISDYIDLTVGSNQYHILVNKGSSRLVIARFAEGTYEFNAVYQGNENFTKATASGSFKVVDDLLDLRLNAKNLTYFYGNDKNLVVSAVDENNNPISGINITAKFGGVTYTRTSDDNGEISIPIKLGVGKYAVSIRSIENARYHASNASSTIEILSTLEGIDVTSIYGTSAQYFAIFTDLNGKALGNAIVKLVIGKNSYTVSTLPNGIARVNINFSPGNYKISVTNPATGQKITNKIFIFNKLMGNKNVVKYFGGSQTYKVRAYDNKGNPVGAGKVVTFKINGKTIKVKTNKKGYASCKLKFKPKTYKITATYGGFKVSNKIKIKPVLTAKNISKKKGKKIKFKAKLVNTKGKALKGKKITFKFKGKTYKVKTNKKGVATLKLKKKLKVGKHKIVSKYGKSKITNKIKIKK